MPAHLAEASQCAYSWNHYASSCNAAQHIVLRSMPWPHLTGVNGLGGVGFSAWECGLSASWTYELRFDGAVIHAYGTRSIWLVRG